MRALARFSCSKNGLIALNVMYLFVAMLLIAVGAYAKTAGKLTSLSITGGIVATGVLLLLISLMGLVAAWTHNQVGLFVYIIALFLIGLIQFFVAIACLSVNEEQRAKLAYMGWIHSKNETLTDVEASLRCCGFKLIPQGVTRVDVKHATCGCTGEHCRQDCAKVSMKLMARGLKIAGGVGLFFSFTELIGIWLAVRYRNMKDPRANPNAFL